MGKAGKPAKAAEPEADGGDDVVAGESGGGGTATADEADDMQDVASYFEAWQPEWRWVDDEWDLPAGPSASRSLQLDVGIDKQQGIATDVTPTCDGQYPIVITFDLDMAYRASDPSLRGTDLIMSFPFSTTGFRTGFVDGYLKIDGDGDGISGFDDLYCVSRLRMPGDTDSPTSSPRPSEAATTAEPSLTPSEGPSLMPSDVPSEGPSLMPSEGPS
ncbi:hypothetical protein THAOC_17395, partial [Thalassiosira oceanica]